MPLTCCLGKIATSSSSVAGKEASASTMDEIATEWVHVEIVPDAVHSQATCHQASSWKSPHLRSKASTGRLCGLPIANMLLHFAVRTITW